LSVSVSGLVMA